MSVDTFVFVRDENLPTIQQWQAALDRAGTGIVLESIEDLRSHSGYLPATHRGQESGFEWYYGPLADYFGGTPPDGLGKRSHVINFVTHSDMRELVCALISGAVLAEIAEGLVFDEENEAVIDGKSALVVARSIERDEKL
jgi:hypothetical protein